MVARPAAARVAAAIYGLSLVALFGTSAAYHRIGWTDRARARMRRLDHCMIYILIAGTYAPFGLLVLRAPWSAVVLGLVGGGAIAGILIQVFAFDRMRVVSVVLYIVLGWLVPGDEETEPEPEGFRLSRGLSPLHCGGRHLPLRIGAPGCPGHPLRRAAVARRPSSRRVIWDTHRT